MVKYYHQFWGKIKTIKSYLIKFKKNSFMKSKVYLDDYTVENKIATLWFLSRIIKVFLMLIMIVVYK